MDSYNESSDNCTIEMTEEADYGRGLSLLAIALVAMFGNFMTIFIMLKFKTIKIPDLLVIALAVDDLIATLIPITMSIIAYLRGRNYEMDSHACNFFGVIAAYTRFTAALLVTVISIERYLAVKKPLFYRKHCTPSLFKKLLVLVFVFNALLAFPPAVDPNTPINEYRAFCLFSFTRIYAIFIVIYAHIQFIIVLFCFICIVKELYNLHRRRKKMTAQNMYNKYSNAMRRESLTFSKPGLASKVSDLGQKLKKTAPAIGEWLQLSIEAQFARMLLVVTILFYINWMPTVVLIMYTMAKEGIILNPKQRECTENIEGILFWTIRATVISTALNPLLYGFLAQQYRSAYFYLLKVLFSKCCFCVSSPSENVFLQDRKQHVQWNRDHPPVQQVNFKKIGTYRPRFLNGYDFGNASTTSSNITSFTTQTNLSLPDLEAIPEDSIISAENGQISVHFPNVGDVHSSIAITQSTNAPHSRRLKSASMDELLDDDINLRQITANPLHDSDDSTIQMNNQMSTSEMHLITDKVFQATTDSLHNSDESNIQMEETTTLEVRLMNDKSLPATTNLLHNSDEPNRQINGLVHHTLPNENQSTNEEDHVDPVNNAINLTVDLDESNDASFLTVN